MSNVIIVANKVTLKGIGEMMLLETFFSKNNPFRMPLPSGLCRRCGKGRHWTNECRKTKNSQSNPLPKGNSLRGLSQAPMPNSIQSFPVIVEETSSQSN